MTDIEGAAEAIYFTAGTTTHEPTSPLHLASLLFGRSGPAVFTVPKLERSVVLLRNEVLVRAGTPLRKAERLAAWCLAEWWLEYRGPWVPLLATCIRAPRPAVAEFLADDPFAFSDLARAFQITESSAVLRCGEIANVPVVLDAPERPTRIRGFRRRPRQWHRFNLSDRPGAVAMFGF